MAKLDIDFKTKLSPDGVVAALTDFSDRRPVVWPFLDRDLYSVVSLDATSAVVDEGSKRPIRVAARERYNWSTPNAVSWTIEESDSFASGTTMIVRATPRSDGGSDVRLSWERVGKTFRGRVIVALILLLRGRPLASTYKKVFDGLAS